MKKELFKAIALLTATSTLGQVSNEVATTQSITVSATRIDTPIEQMGTSVSVVTEKEIAQYHATDVLKALRHTPGIQSSQSGGPGTASSTYIRGANANHTLVLVNGVRVNSNTTGSFNLSSIATDSINRIEVLKGPQSALYGGDSIGGVINIVTKKGFEAPLGGSIVYEMGTKGYINTLAQLSGGNKIADFFINASFEGLNEFDIASKHGGIEDDPYERRSIMANLGLNFAVDGRADLTVLANKNETALDGWGGADTPNKFSEEELFTTSLDISKPITDIYEQGLTVSYNKSTYTGTESFVQDSHLETENYDFNAQSDFYLHDYYTLNVGYDFRYSEASNEGNFEKKDRTANALYLNNQFSPNDNLFITLGARVDDYSDFETKGTYQSTISWNLLEGSRIHGSIGTGYKAPTFNDLYWPDDGFSVGNPDVKSEQSTSFDIGWEQTLLEKKIVMDVTYFQSDIEDLIEWAPNSDGKWTPTNVNDAEIRGVETSLTYQPYESLYTKAFYTYTDARDANTQEQLARRAKNNAGLSIGYDFLEKAHLNMDYVYTGKRYNDPANSTALKGFGLVHLGASYNLTPDLKIIGNIDNLFDEYYETVEGYGTVGRVVSAGVDYSF